MLGMGHCQCTGTYAGAWKDAVPAFAEQGFQCPQFKNPTDYFMKVASDVENIPKLADAQQHRWAQTGSERFSARAIAAGNAKDSEVAKGTLTVHTRVHNPCCTL